MTATMFLAMVAAYANYYGPMLDTWRIIFLASSICVGLLLFVVLVVQRGLSAYL
jgi:hypothetical protein